MRRWLAAGVAVLAMAACSSGSKDATSGGAVTTTEAGPTTTSAPKITQEKKLGAFDVCKEFVKDRLKSPSSAKFRNFFQNDGEVTVTSTDGRTYTVVSSVDSENSFGASLRSDFTCTVTNTSGDHWQLQDINIT